MSIPKEPLRTIKVDGAVFYLTGPRGLLAYYNESRDFVYEDEFLASDYFGLTEYENTGGYDYDVPIVEYYLPEPSVQAMPPPSNGYEFTFNLGNGAVFTATYELGTSTSKCDNYLFCEK